MLPLFVADELRRLDEKDQGKLLLKVNIPTARGRRMKRDIFLRPSPDSLTEGDSLLRHGEIELAEYINNFNNVAGMTEHEKAVCIQHHPHPDSLPLAAPILDSPSTAEPASSDHEISQMLAETASESESCSSPVFTRSRARARVGNNQ